MLLSALLACSGPDSFLRQYATLTHENDVAWFDNYYLNSEWECGRPPEYEVEQYASATAPVFEEGLTTGIRDYHAGTCVDATYEDEPVVRVAHYVCWALRQDLGESCDEIDPDAAAACLASIRFASCEDIDWEGYKANAWTPGQPECSTVCR